MLNDDYSLAAYTLCCETFPDILFLSPFSFNPSYEGSSVAMGRKTRNAAKFFPFSIKGTTRITNYRGVNTGLQAQ